jgi:hypothetical protein
MLFPVRNFKFLFLLNALFQNSEKLIKVKTLAPFYTHKNSMPLNDLVFEKNGIISLIRYHIKGGVVTNFGILS